jgi:hypothetical protein
MSIDETRALRELTQAATAWASIRRGLEAETVEERNLRSAIHRYHVTEATLHPEAEVGASQSG